MIRAIWAALGIVASIIWVLWNHFYAAPPTPATDVLVAQVREIVYYTPKWPVFFFAITAPFAAMILGGISLSHIKRSGGNLYGLRLAQADVLFFPLLLLSVAAMALGTIIVRGPLRSSGLDEWIFWSPRQEVLMVLIALPIWIFSARAFWRAVVGPRDAFAVRRIPLVGELPLTGKAALAAVVSHAWPWHWIIMPSPIQRSLTISNFDDMSALQSLWLLVLSIGLGLFASAATLTRPTKTFLRIGSVSAAAVALVIQVQFFRSLGEFEPGQVEKVVRLTRTYSHMGVYVTMALTGLAMLFFVLRMFDEQCGIVARRNDETTSRQ